MGRNKGTGKHHTCNNCHNIHTGTGESFCSIECRNIFWKEHGNPNLGSRRTEATKAKMSDIAARRLAAHPESHPNHALAKAGHKTKIEEQVEGWLKGLAVAYDIKSGMGKYWLDFYVPAWDTAFGV